MMAQQIVVSDRMQTHYEYLLIQPTGDCFAPEFQPQLSPQKMLELGVFGGKYMTDCIEEFPVRESAYLLRGSSMTIRRRRPLITPPISRMS